MDSVEVRMAKVINSLGLQVMELAEALRDVVEDAKYYERQPVDLRSKSLDWVSISNARRLLDTRYPFVLDYIGRADVLKELTDLNKSAEDYSAARKMQEAMDRFEAIGKRR